MFLENANKPTNTIEGTIEYCTEFFMTWGVHRWIHLTKTMTIDEIEKEARKYYTIRFYEATQLGGA